MLRSGGALAALLAGASSAVSICGAQPIDTLADLSEGRRNARLGAAIRDAGFVCEKVVETTKTEAPVPAWRVVCNDALVYLASSDENDDALHVEPLPYAEPPNGESVELRELPEQPPETRP
jgi:hypothetical protein